MKTLGIDFTSAPSHRKPITCAVGEFDKGQLTIVEILHWSTFGEFEAFLAQGGSWWAGCDFPIGLPEKLIRNLGWPATWEDYVTLVSSMSKNEFVEVLVEYSSSRPQGDRHHLRTTDRLASALSPMMVYGIPVGRMFYEGATRLLESDVNLIPCRLTSPISGTVRARRNLVEVYPALVARSLIGRRSYKGKDNQERRSARKEIVDQLESQSSCRVYDICVGIHIDTNPLIEEPHGDCLDAVLASIQVAWLVDNLDPWLASASNAAEGWIADPVCVI